MIAIESMRYGYGKKPLFDGMDLVLHPGGLYGLLGLNGAGKTSLLKLIAGALLPQYGSIRVFGRNPARREAAHLADVVFVPEDPWLPPIKPAEWLKRYAPFRPNFDRSLFDYFAREFDFAFDIRLSRWSYGQQKRFTLATALASGARTILLDEPTNGLDIPSKMQLRQILATTANADRVIIISTHQIRDLESLIDPILIMDKGKMPFHLTADQISKGLYSSRLTELPNRDVVFARRDSLGWSAILSGRPSDTGGPADLEMLFQAATLMPDRLTQALAGEPLGAYPEGGH